MRRYWITVERLEQPTPLNLGIGVTARSEDDARVLVERQFGASVVISDVREIDDMRSIEKNHVAPNMGDHMTRGVWFPQG